LFWLLVWLGLQWLACEGHEVVLSTVEWLNSALRTTTQLSCLAHASLCRHCHMLLVALQKGRYSLLLEEMWQHVRSPSTHQPAARTSTEHSTTQRGQHPGLRS
jgi:hypothetical protein